MGKKKVLAPSGSQALAALGAAALTAAAAAWLVVYLTDVAIAAVLDLFA